MREIPCPLAPRWLRWGLVIAVAGAVFYLSVIAVPPEQPIVEPPGGPDLVPLDKWRHFLAYAGVGVALAYATIDWERSTLRLAALVLAVTVTYGVGIEVVQAGLPHRYFSPGDAYANALGALLASPLFLLRSRFTYVRLGWSEARGSR